MENYNCAECNVKLTLKEYDYSTKNYNKLLCYICQRIVDEDIIKKAEEIIEKRGNSISITSGKWQQDMKDKNFDPAFLGMTMKIAWDNARTYEKTYEEARDKLGLYFAETLDLAVKLTKR